MGRTQFLFGTIQLLKQEGFDLGVVITARGEPHYSKKENDFKALAWDLQLPFKETQVFDDETCEFLRNSDSDIVFSVNWPYILREPALSTVRLGFVNAHAGDLPRYRGNACPNWAIIRGEKQIGLTLHRMVADSLDSGPILVKESLALSDSSYIGDCYDWLESEIPRSFARLAHSLDHYIANQLEQESLGVVPLRCFARRPSDSIIDWGQPTQTIHRLIRASSRPFEGSQASFEGREIRVWRAEPWSPNYEIVAMPGSILHSDSRGVVVSTGDGALLLQEVTFWQTEHPEGTDALPYLARKTRGRVS